ALFSQQLELGIRRGGLGLEFGEQGLLGLLLGGNAVGESGLQIFHAKASGFLVSDQGGRRGSGCATHGPKRGAQSR
ncbi:hypothetical protein DKP78_17550, partial [Enterococcus faecium]